MPEITTPIAFTLGAILLVLAIGSLVAGIIPGSWQNPAIRRSEMPRSFYGYVKIYLFCGVLFMFASFIPEKYANFDFPLAEIFCEIVFLSFATASGVLIYLLRRGLYSWTDNEQIATGQRNTTPNMNLLVQLVLTLSIAGFLICASGYSLKALFSGKLEYVGCEVQLERFTEGFNKRRAERWSFCVGLYDLPAI